MYNTLLERQANDAKDDINYVIENLIVEIHELEEAHEKLEDTIEIYVQIIEGLKGRIHELESELNEKNK
jgi:peptidoglycan hydrolase CwlO-like protein